jgi:hypothetical protein
LFVLCWLHQWGSAQAMPADLAVRDCVEFHRAEAVRQRDLLCSSKLVTQRLMTQN